QWIDQYIFNVVGQLFLSMIFMMVVPVVFISIVLGVVGVGDPKTLGSLGIKTLSFYLVTTAIAITIAIIVALVLQPGIGQSELLGSSVIEHYRSNELGGEKRQWIDLTVEQTLINIIPTTVVEAMCTTIMLQIISFAIFIVITMIAVNDNIPGLIKL